MIQFNKNSFALAPSSQNVPVAQVAPGSTQTAHLPLVQNPALLSPTAASAVLQVTWTKGFLVSCVLKTAACQLPRLGQVFWHHDYLQ